MGKKRNSNSKLIAVAIVALVASFAMLFQNCSPTTLTTDAEDLYSDAPAGGDSSYRLPAGFNETLNTGITCAATMTATTVASGEPFTFNFTTTGVLPSGYRVYVYGTKNGIPDASEISPSFFQALSATYTNPGYIGGTYTRYFQMRDTAGRVLCQTNTLTFTLIGRQCTLTTPTPVARQGYLMVMNTAYAAGTTAPVTGADVRFNGTTNGIPVLQTPYDQTDYLTYSKVAQGTEVGNDYVRYITVHNTDGTIYCQTNAIRITVLR